MPPGMDPIAVCCVCFSLDTVGAILSGTRHFCWTRAMFCKESPSAWHDRHGLRSRPSQLSKRVSCLGLNGEIRQLARLNGREGEAGLFRLYIPRFSFGETPFESRIRLIFRNGFD